jgi:hypothetical protein
VFELIRKELTDLNLFGNLGNVYNADESCFPLNSKPPSKAFAEKGATNAMRQTCVEGDENVTVVACSNITGHLIPPFFIFKGRRFYREFIRKFS